MGGPLAQVLGDYSGAIVCLEGGGENDGGPCESESSLVNALTWTFRVVRGFLWGLLPREIRERDTCLKEQSKRRHDYTQDAQAAILDANIAKLGFLAIQRRLYGNSASIGRTLEHRDLPDDLGSDQVPG